jgi:toxin ParE1/3/4
MPAVLSRPADADLSDAARWIKKNNPGAAARFKTAVVAALTQIGDNPGSGFQRPEFLPDRYRIVVLTDFPYLLIYDCVRRPPVVVRILHGARDLPALLQDL